jgi:transposase
MWAAVGEQAVYFTVGPRSKEMAENILNGFAGTLMSDGYGAYRFFADRARCWAHLKRKAQGLSESWHQEAAAFGRVALKAWNVLIRLVHKMRELPAERREVVCRAAERVEALLLYHCLKQKDASHEATKAFCTEMTRDAPAIFAVLKRPELPLTNNGAERALRPLVIMRKISYGSKSQEGARSIALLASVEATLARQGRDAWHFYRDLLAACRAGQSPPTLIFSSA